MKNELWRLARKPPHGWPELEDFRWCEETVPEPAVNQMLTRTVYLSLDPYQWGRRRGGVEVPGDVCHGRTVSQVIASRLPGYIEGDYVFNTNGWQRYGLSGDTIDVFGYMFPRKIDPDQAPISTAIGVMGMVGLTAYAGLIFQCAPQPGETVVVSAASGGVGEGSFNWDGYGGAEWWPSRDQMKSLPICEPLEWMQRYLTVRVSSKNSSTPVLTAAISILKMSEDRYSRRSCHC